MWTVQRKSRKDGWYYEAVLTEPITGRRCVSLKYLEGAPKPAAVAKRLRDAQEWVDKAGSAMSDEEVRAYASGETPTKNRQIRKLLTGKLTGAAAMGFPVIPPSDPTALPALPAHVGTPLNRYGIMLLTDFHHRVWWPMREKSVADVTRVREEQLWMQMLREIGEVRICDLDRVRWDVFLAGKSDWGPTSKRLAQNTYKQCLDYAVAIKAIGETHTFGAIIGSTKKEGREPRALRMPEVKAHLDAADTPAHRALYAVMYGQGLRPGEAEALTWDLWDLEAQVCWPAGTKNKQATKPVPLTPFTMNEIRPYWESLGKPTEGPCFTWQGKPMGRIYKGFRASAERAGLGHVVPYDGRHTFATTMARAGLDAATARRMMRHASHSRILERAYQHLDLKDLADAVSAMPS